MGKQAQHTPGPWINDEPYIRDATGEATVASVRDGSYRRGASISYPEQCANAHLIAAAPELFAALDRVTTQLQHEYPNDEAWVQARAALAKAQGGAA